LEVKAKQVKTGTRTTDARGREGLKKKRESKNEEALPGTGEKGTRVPAKKGPGEWWGNKREGGGKGGQDQVGRTSAKTQTPTDRAERTGGRKCWQNSKYKKILARRKS